MSALPGTERHSTLAPLPPSAINAAWVTAALHDAGVLDAESSVTSVRSTAIGHGLVCDSVRFDLTYSEGSLSAPASLVCKFSSQDPRERSAAVAEQTYHRELTFYRDLAPGLKVPTPRCFAIAGDEASEFVLVLEDLAAVSKADQLAGCSLAQAEAVIDAAVGLHAAMWGDDSLDTAGWSVRNSWLPRATQVYPRALRRYLRDFGPSLSPEQVQIGERLVPILDLWFARQPRPWTLTHGDFRLDNMLFGIRNGAQPVGVLDWQTMIPGPATADVAYFLGSCFEPDQRRAHEDALVRRYHAGLVAAGVSDYPFERCWRDYRYSCFLGYFMCTYSAGGVRRTPRSDAMFDAWMRRVSAQILDLDCLALLPEGTPPTC